MADAWGTTDMAEALPEVTNHDSNGSAPVANPKNEEAHKAAREHGWVEPSAYDYAAGNAGANTNPSNVPDLGEPA